jgi:Gamma-glutamyl cyclotransferase, AIG2-like
MDNTVTLPGYKYYLAPDGSRPDVCVAFLDVRPDAHASAHGVLLPVDAAALAALDARERQYERVDVSGQVDGVRGTVWVYAGREESRRRFAAALDDGRCVVARSYLDLVAPVSGGPLPPVRELQRVDVD